MIFADLPGSQTFQPDKAFYLKKDFPKKTGGSAEIIHGCMMNRSPDTTWVTRKTIMQKTGISEAELAAYIAAGILPQPSIKGGGGIASNPEESQVFPGSVIWRINLVKRLEAEGESMETIASQFGDIAGVEPMEPSPEVKRSGMKKRNDGFAEESPTLSMGARSFDEPPILLEKEVPKGLDKPFSEPLPLLTLKHISHPAYLVNEKIEVEWLNQGAEEFFFNQKIGLRNRGAERNLLGIIFGFGIQSNLENWQDLLSVHFPYLRTFLKAGVLDKGWPGIGPSEKAILDDMFQENGLREEPPESISALILIERSGLTRGYQVQTLEFDQGMLYIFVPTDATVLQYGSNELAIRKKILEHFGDKPCLSLPLCVLTAKLHPSQHLRDSLMPEIYFGLIREVYAILERCRQKYHGIQGTNEGDWCRVYFIQNEKTNYLTDAIDCALEIMESIKGLHPIPGKFPGQLEQNLCINIGVSDGTEFVGIVGSVGMSGMIKVDGAAEKCSELLSSLGKNGEIWVTKTLLGKLESKILTRYEFGLYGTSHGYTGIIPGLFIKAKEVIGSGKEPLPVPWALDLDVTQIRSNKK